MHEQRAFQRQGPHQSLPHHLTRAHTHARVRLLFFPFSLAGAGAVGRRAAGAGALQIGRVVHDHDPGGVAGTRVRTYAHPRPQSRAQRGCLGEGMSV
eukprot:351797-Chlamydomonas_euryale.AAC.3